MIIKARVKRNAYFDSITLMKIARSLTEMPGIDDAAVIMATEQNLQMLAEAKLSPPDVEAGPADVLMVVRTADAAGAELALQFAEEQLVQRTFVSADGTTGYHKQPRSIGQAVKMQPQARVAAISVPGPYAALEAERALRAGLHVFLFSDNVPLEDEIPLKHLAEERGRLLMGPDCGTAMLNGVGLGFVNVVPPGPIGIVGASGTGIQQVMSLAAQQGCGVSQVIGSGGRDLSEAVGGITTLRGLKLLQDDLETQVIVLVSKPPAPSVAERVLEAAATGKKPVVVIFVGADHEHLQHVYGDRVIIARTLAEAAHQAVSLCNVGHPTADAGHVHDWPVGMVRPKGIPQHRLSGLFSGGTLCDEAMHIWSEYLGPIYSNIPLEPAWRIVEGQPVQGHRAIDFGADEYTRGRPHPMIDPSLRLKRFEEEARHPHVRVLFLDMVLGYCSHPDPVSVYGPAIREAQRQAARAGRALTCVISLCGTEDDPQQLSLQAAQFREAGAEVFSSNADAALRCIEILS
jgi:FdrA protein